jgi:signal peptidase I
METRLFFIGVAMGVYAYATRRWSKSGKLDSRMAASLWHALFYLLAGFGITLVAVLSIESRVRFVDAASGVLTMREILTGLVGGLLLGTWGYFRAWTQGTEEEKRRFYVEEDLEWAETVFSAVLLAAVLMYFVVQAFKIPSGSMLNTLKIGDHLFVNKFIYGFKVPLTDRRLLPMKDVQRGDIMVFRFPTEDREEIHCGSVQYGKDFIKRVIGLPGETVAIRDGRVLINGETLPEEPYVHFRNAVRYPEPSIRLEPERYQQLWEDRQLDGKLGDTMKDHFGPVKIPDEAYFVMGDNRDASCDGRFWGPVQKKYLKGKAWILYWPPNRMGGIS